MDTKFSELIAKLIILGHKVKITGNNSLVLTDINTNKMSIVVRDGDKVITSDEYDGIEHLLGTDYYLVRKQAKYGIVKGVNKVTKMSSYKKLSRCALASNGKYNIIAELDNSLYGVIDTDDKCVIPFCNSQIELYRFRNKWIYMVYTLDFISLYQDSGKLYGISDIMGNNDVFICEDYILMYNYIGDGYYREYKVCDIDGTILNTFKNVNIINTTNGYCQLIDENNTVVLDNIYLAKKY